MTPPLPPHLKENVNYGYHVCLLVCCTFGGCGGPERYQMLIAINGNYGYLNYFTFSM